MLDLPRTAPPTPPRPPQPSVLLHLSAGPHRALPACLRLPKLTVQTVRHMHATHARLTMSKPTTTAPACSRRAVFVHRVLCAQRLCTATGHRSRRGLQLRPHTHVQTQSTPQPHTTGPPRTTQLGAMSTPAPSPPEYPPRTLASCRLLQSPTTHLRCRRRCQRPCAARLQQRSGHTSLPGVRRRRHAWRARMPRDGPRSRLRRSATHDRWPARHAAGCDSHVSAAARCRRPGRAVLRSARPRCRASGAAPPRPPLPISPRHRLVWQRRFAHEPSRLHGLRGACAWVPVTAISSHS